MKCNQFVKYRTKIKNILELRLYSQKHIRIIEYLLIISKQTNLLKIVYDNCDFPREITNNNDFLKSYGDKNIFYIALRDSLIHNLEDVAM